MQQSLQALHKLLHHDACVVGILLQVTMGGRDISRPTSAPQGGASVGNDFQRHAFVRSIHRVHFPLPLRCLPNIAKAPLQSTIQTRSRTQAQHTSTRRIHLIVRNLPWRPTRLRLVTSIVPRSREPSEMEDRRTVYERPILKISRGRDIMIRSYTGYAVDVALILGCHSVRQ
jgi:hypothetical protein